MLTIQGACKGHRGHHDVHRRSKFRCHSPFSMRTTAGVGRSTKGRESALQDSVSTAHVVASSRVKISPLPSPQPSRFHKSGNTQALPGCYLGRLRAALNHRSQGWDQMSTYLLISLGLMSLQHLTTCENKMVKLPPHPTPSIFSFLVFISHLFFYLICYSPAIILTGPRTSQTCESDVNSSSTSTDGSHNNQQKDGAV